ncbi:MAG: hypothetical protein ACE5MI_10790 [Acidimicrobiia bacterium]
MTVGPDQPPEPEKPRLPWLLVLALVIGGVALGYLLGANTGVAPSPPLTNEELTANEAASGGEERDRILIPGYQGLLAALLMSGGNLELAVWGPYATKPERIVMGAELFNSLDLNSTRVWAAARSTSGASSFLHLGSIQTPFPLEPYQEGITSFAWHLVDPSGMAWTQKQGDGRTVLVSASPGVVRNPTGTSRPDADTREVTEVPDGTFVRAFGEGWYLLQGPDGLVTLDEQGGVLGSTLHEFAAAGPSGALLLYAGDEFVLTDPNLEDLTPAGFVPRGVAFSPDGDRVAYLERSADGTFLRIAPVGEPAERSWELGAAEQSRPLAAPMDWTFDGFVLMPSEMMGSSYVMALNVATGNFSEFGVDGRVVGLWGFRGTGA